MSKKDDKAQEPKVLAWLKSWNLPREAWHSLVLVALAIIVLILALALTRETGESQINVILSIILGIMSSLIASVLLFFLQKAFIRNEHAELTKKLDVIEDALKRKDSLYDSGIRSIRPKTDFDKEGTFWSDILNNTEDQLDLVGHSIRTWFYPEFREAFFKKVTAMLNAEKEVRIVLAPKSKPWFNCVFNASLNRFEWKSVSKAGKTVRDLYQLLQGVDPQKRKYLKVYVANSTKVTYMYIRTDEQSIISPYIFSPANSPHTFLLELEPKSAYAKAFERDFEDMIEDLDCLDLGGFLT